MTLREDDGPWRVPPSVPRAASCEAGTYQNQKTRAAVSSVVERGQSQSSGVGVCSAEVTGLSQNPGALNLVYSVEVTDLNQKLSDRHWGRTKSLTCDSGVF